MLKQCKELKNHCAERANYYSKLEFSVLAEEFSSITNFLGKIEEMLKEQEVKEEKNEA